MAKAHVVHPPWLTVRGEDVMLDVVVSPRGTRNRVVGVHDDRLKIQLAAPPVEGKANDELRRFLADALGIQRVRIEIVGGLTSRKKTVRLAQVPAHLVVLKLSPLQG